MPFARNLSHWSNQINPVWRRVLVPNFFKWEEWKQGSKQCWNSWIADGKPPSALLTGCKLDLAFSLSTFAVCLTVILRQIATECKSSLIFLAVYCEFRQSKEQHCSLAQGIIILDTTFGKVSSTSCLSKPTNSFRFILWSVYERVSDGHLRKWSIDIKRKFLLPFKIHSWLTYVLCIQTILLFLLECYADAL